MSTFLKANLLCYILFAVFLHPVLAAQKPLFRMHGSNTIGAELGPALVREWLKTQGYSDIGYHSTSPQEGVISARTTGGRPVAVEVQAHGSSAGFRDLDAELTDLAMASRPIKKKELQKLARFGDLDRHASEYVLGLDGIAVIVNRDNPVHRLEKSELRRIFAGEVTDWRQVGGEPGPIQVYARDDKSGTYDTFKSLVLGKKTALVAGARRFESNANLSDAVSRDPTGIGFVGLPYVRDSKAVAVSDGPSRPIVPESFSVATEDYALTRRLFLYVPYKGANPMARQFAEFAVSSEGQAVVEKVGFISQRIVTGSMSPSESAPDEYLRLTKGAWRLSLNFRFREGETALDNKAMRDVERLVAFMRREENRGRDLMLFGFADSNEIIPLHSLELSIHRADSVADLLIRRGNRSGTDQESPCRGVVSIERLRTVRKWPHHGKGHYTRASPPLIFDA